MRYDLYTFHTRTVTQSMDLMFLYKLKEGGEYFEGQVLNSVPNIVLLFGVYFVVTIRRLWVTY